MNVALADGVFKIAIEPRNGEELSTVRGLPTRKFEEGIWLAPYTIENYQHLVDRGYDPAEWSIPPATKSGYSIGMHGKLLKIRTPRNQSHKCRDIPEYRHWKDALTAWVCKPTRRNILYLVDVFPNVEWNEGAEQLRDEALGHVAMTITAAEDKANLTAQREVEITDFKFGVEPFPHQKLVFKLSRDARHFALLMEQGTGKTKVVIDTAIWQYIRSNVTGVLVVSPNSVKDVWAEEIEFHAPDYINCNAVIYSSNMRAADKKAMHEMIDHPANGSLDFLIMNVEAFSVGTKAYDLAERFLKGRQVLMAVDEFTRIKTPGSKRTKNVIKLGAHAKFKRMLSGTPVTKGPLDVFAPFKYLDQHILGFGSYYAFRNHFAIMGGYNGKEVVAYANLPELQKLIDPHSFRVLRSECLDLPDKIYQKLVVPLAPEQQKLYDKMRDEMVAELNEAERVTTTMVLVQMLRLQQIVGGFVGGVSKQVVQDEHGLVLDAGGQAVRSLNALDSTTVREIPGRNPKVEALLELADDVTGKIIVWSRFRPEIRLLSAALRKKYGPESVVEFHGGVSVADRKQHRLQFQDLHSPVRFFVGNQAAGGLGITLTAANTVVYYSNSFSLEERLQSEDRSHRIGTKGDVTYIDLMAHKTIDDKFIASLRGKQSMANQITGDNWREWI